MSMQAYIDMCVARYINSVNIHSYSIHRKFIHSIPFLLSENHTKVSMKPVSCSLFFVVLQNYYIESKHYNT